MRRAILCSCALHVVVALLAYFHLWDLLFPPPPLEPATIAVSLVNLAPETKATRPNPKPKVADKPAEETVEAPKESPKQPPKPVQPPPAPAPAPAPEEVAQAPAPEPKPEPKPEPPQPPPPPPPPVPTEQPEPPKPEPPKPPPKPAPPKTTEAKKKPDDHNLDSFLKNLAKRPEAAKPEEQPTKTAPQPQVARASAQPSAPLGAQLTTSELDVIREQIKPCWNYDPGARDADQLQARFSVEMNADGTVRTVVSLDADKMSDPVFRAAADAARRALLNPQCQPLKFPAEKYAQWRSFTAVFSPRDFQ
ncbi:MAG TPA: energy transducer TonB [Stellaceae bacterium]|nr:energy transducer TonB [Stellaceae bacterium]